MFTGIIEAAGRVRGFSGARLEIEVPRNLARLKKGASLAVNGTCLTVAGRSAGTLRFDVVAETRRRTALGILKHGDRVNLERPLKVSSRLDGHFVLGHVDGVGRVKRLTPEKKGMSALVSFPAPIRRFLVEKGSVTVDGVSLTLGKVSKPGFWIHLVPHTLKVTSLGGLKPGTRVNLEADVLAKLVLNRIR